MRFPGIESTGLNRGIVLSVGKNLWFHGVGIALALTVKGFYSTAGADDLVWILQPLAFLVTLATGIHFQFDATAGFVSIADRVVIAPACAGINFLIICFATIFFTLVPRLQTAVQKWLWLATCIVSAYVVTLWANSARIIFSIYLYGAPIYGAAWITPERVHRLAGTLLYVPVLVMTYVIAERVVVRHCRKVEAAPAGVALPGTSLLPRIMFAPLAWYLAIAVVVPLLNCSLHRYGTHYLEHALFVVVATSSMVLIWLVLVLVKKNIDLFRETKENKARP